MKRSRKPPGKDKLFETYPKFSKVLVLPFLRKTDMDKFPRLIYFKGEGEVTIPIEGDTFILGRGFETDMRFTDDLKVSREHCRIFQKDNQFYVEDLGSRNGTYLNSQKITEVLQLRENDILKVGSRKLLFCTTNVEISEEDLKKMDKILCKECKGLIPTVEIMRGLARKTEMGEGYICPECSAEDSRVGSVIHHYMILEKIAQGGMGIVYKARHQVLDSIVAIKLVREKASGEDHDAIQRFMREVRLGSRITHPNIVRFLDAGIESGTYYLIMDYYKGESLAEKLIKQKTLYEKMWNIADQLFSAVESIHQAEVIHRDIKPSNILLLDDGTIKLIDFGLVKSTAVEKEPSLTATGTALGTMFYISPEQYGDSKDVDLRTDIYSIGATLYHMMCGVPPLYGESDIEFYNRMRDFNITHPSEKNPDVSRLVGNWVMKALSHDPDDRFATVAEFRDAFPGIDS